MSYNILPSPEEGAVLLRFAPHKPHANQIMTGNNSGTPRLTIFVLTPAATNELFTKRRAAGASRMAMATLGASLIVARACPEAPSKKNNVATGSDLAHAAPNDVFRLPNTAMLCPSFASLAKGCDLNARNRPKAEEAGLEKCSKGCVCFRISWRVMRGSASFGQRRP
jgi:hypothetical protein